MPPAPGLGQVGRAGAVTRSPRVPASDARQRATPGPALTVGCRAPAWTSTCWAEPAVPAALLLPGSQRPSRPPPHGRSVQRPAPPSRAAPRMSVRKRSPHACAVEHVGGVARRTAPTQDRHSNFGFRQTLCRPRIRGCERERRTEGGARQGKEAGQRGSGRDRGRRRGKGRAEGSQQRSRNRT